MEITGAIVHGLEKEANVHEVHMSLRPDILQVDDRLTNLGANVLKAYGRVSNNYGGFDADTETYRFPELLHAYLAGNSTMADFSQATTRIISARMGESLPATGGYALFLRYQSLGRDWLLIAMLKLKASTGIDFNTLSLTESLAFDISHLHEAARIDLQKWRNGEQPYLSFIKRSGSREDVTRYFRSALGCTEYTDSRFNTKQALQAVDAFCANRQWTAEQRQEARRITYNYCDEKAAAKEPVNLTALSAKIHDQEPDAFIQFVRENQYPVSETFAPHKATYSRFKRLSGRVGSVKVSFDVDDLLNDTIAYDSASNSLIVRNLSVTFRDEILKAQGNAASPQ